MNAEENAPGGKSQPAANDARHRERAQWQKRADGWYGRAIGGGDGAPPTLVSVGGRGASINQDFKIDVVETETATCLTVRGELDLATVPAFLQAIADCAPTAARPVVTIDLAALAFIDSTGLRGLLEAHAGIQSHGGHLEVINWAGQPKRLFELAGVLSRPPFIPPPAD